MQTTDTPALGTANPLAPLFTPLSIGSLTLPNRIVMSPMTRGCATDGVIPAEAVDYYRRRAEGGTGLIITEGIAVNLDGTLDQTIPRLDCEASRMAWRAVTDAVHQAGAKIIAQLWHTGLMRGMQSGEAGDEGRRLGPSAVYPIIDGQGETVSVFAEGEAMSRADIARTIADCATFARRAEEAGFDGVEIHGAHGYLFDEFFWDKTNRRDDEYNGDIAARTRFTTETIAAIRAATSPGFVIGLRFSQWKNPAEHYPIKLVRDPAELAAFLKPLVAAGIDFFDCSTRRYWEPAFAGSDKSLAQWTQELSGKPAMAVGSITVSLPLNTRDIGETAAVADNLAPLAALVDAGRIDLVGVGRAVIANPDWANVVRASGIAGLRPYEQSQLLELY
ncbi:12-oxophytodienoate reductase [Novosphingobium bradum]|uniref:12-oxophytodienoate reductase n=1 Tax=Novosphingobium bradum TaxID=1737444 RepID=A0ABV7ILY0_9SPHN